MTELKTKTHTPRGPPPDASPMAVSRDAAARAAAARVARESYGKLVAYLAAASLTLGACGSGDSGSNQITRPAPSAYAYVASAGAGPSAAGAIYEYGLFADSTLSPLSQASISAGVYPAAVIVSQGHVYVVNVGDGTISQYNIASNSTLTPMNPATVTNPGMHTFGAAPASAGCD